jgi:hypothetical protein
MKQWDYGKEFEELWGDLKDKRDGRKASAYKIYLRTKRDYEAKLNTLTKCFWDKTREDSPKFCKCQGCKNNKELKKIKEVGDE